MASRIQTLDWLNAELDSKDSELAAARQELERVQEINRKLVDKSNWYVIENAELSTQLAASRERERKLLYGLLRARDSLFSAYNQNYRCLNGSAEKTCRDGFNEARDVLTELGEQHRASTPSQASAEEVSESRREKELRQERHERIDRAEVEANYQRRIDQLELALKGLLSAMDEPCRLDHSGNCQSHFLENPCSVALATQVLTQNRASQASAEGE